MSTVDFFVAIVMILSIVLAVLRGFTREVLTLVGFAGAALAVIYGRPLANPLFEKMFKDEMTAHIAAGIALGLVTLIVLSLISHQIAKGVSKVGLGMVDRILGAAFGIARAALILCICFIAVRSFSGTVPPWITEAKSAPLIIKGSDRLVALLPEKIQDDIKPSEAKKEKDDLVKDAQKAGDKTGQKIEDGMQKAIGKVDKEKEKLSEPPAPPAKPSEGYDKSERNGLNNLIQKDQKP